jgi:hypothetical protein
MWESRCLTTLWASTACYGKSFTHFNYVDGSSMFLRYVGIRPQDDTDVTAEITILVFQIFGWCIWSSRLARPDFIGLRTNRNSATHDRQLFFFLALHKEPLSTKRARPAFSAFFVMLIFCTEVALINPRQSFRGTIRRPGEIPHFWLNFLKKVTRGTLDMVSSCSVLDVTKRLGKNGYGPDTTVRTVWRSLPRSEGALSTQWFESIVPLEVVIRKAVSNATKRPSPGEGDRHVAPRSHLSFVSYLQSAKEEARKRRD